MDAILAQAGVRDAHVSKSVGVGCVRGRAIQENVLLLDLKRPQLMWTPPGNRKIWYSISLLRTTNHLK